MARSEKFEEIAVLDKAMRLFWEQGYEKTSITDLVDHCLKVNTAVELAVRDAEVDSPLKRRQ